MYTITPMVVALGPQREKSRFTYMHNFGEKVDIPYVSWLLEGARGFVLEGSRLQAPSVPIVMTAPSWKGSTLSPPISSRRSMLS